MKFAAIDVGSNTLQLLIAEFDGERILTRSEALVTTRLGESDPSGRLSAAAIERSAAAIAGFMRQVDAAQADGCRIIATSAVRDADNSADFLRAVALAAPTAPEIEIFSGMQEAALSYAGARVCVGEQYRLPVLDTGGSSSELILPSADGIDAYSANVGAVRIMHNGWTRERVRQKLREVYPEISCRELIGVGGLITTAAGLKQQLDCFVRESIEGVTLSYAELEQLEKRLAALPREQRRKVSPLLEHRGEIMVEGLWIWLSAMELLGTERVRVTCGGILDGAVAAQAHEFCAGIR